VATELAIKFKSHIHTKRHNGLFIALEQRSIVASFYRVLKLKMVFVLLKHCVFVFFLKEYATDTICEAKHLKSLLSGCTGRSLPTPALKTSMCIVLINGKFY